MSLSFQGRGVAMRQDWLVGWRRGREQERAAAAQAIEAHEGGASGSARIRSVRLWPCSVCLRALLESEPFCKAIDIFWGRSSLTQGRESELPRARSRHGESHASQFAKRGGRSE